MPYCFKNTKNGFKLRYTLKGYLWATPSIPHTHPVPICKCKIKILTPLSRNTHSILVETGIHLCSPLSPSCCHLLHCDLRTSLSCSLKGEKDPSNGLLLQPMRIVQRGHLKKDPSSAQEVQNIPAIKLRMQVIYVDFIEIKCVE